MIKKDSFLFGFILGTVAPLLGLVIFKLSKFKAFSFKEIIQFMYIEPGFKTLTVAMSLSLLLNAALFTFYINSRIDKTAKGIFAITIIYGLGVLLIKTFAQ